MPNNEINEELGQENREQDYLDTIAELKKNTVSRQEYDALRAEHTKALKILVEGGQMEPEEKEEVDMAALRKELYGSESSLTNLEYWKKTLALRQAIIDSGANDPFLPYGSKIAPTAEDVEKANNVATVVQECIDYADGDSSLFTQELQRHTIDAMPSVGLRR